MLRGSESHHISVLIWKLSARSWFSSCILEENESVISGAMTGLKTQLGNVQENYEHHLDCQGQKAICREKKRMCHGKHLN